MALHCLVPPEYPASPPPGGPRFTQLLIMAAPVPGGLLLERVLRNAAQLQDCLLSGRSNCAPTKAAPDSTP